VRELSELDQTLAAIANGSAAQAQSENFPVALRLLPAGPRRRLSAVYGYARFVDDLGDKAAGDRLALLDAVAADVRALPAGNARLPVVQALGPALAPTRTGLAALTRPLLDLIEANRFDQGRVRMADFDALMDYCALSAAPIGRLVLALANADDSQNIRDSDAVCAALQVLEHCQDVGEDARADRIYLPAADLMASGATEIAQRHVNEPDGPDEGPSEEPVSELFLRDRTDPRLRAAIAVQVARSAELLTGGPPLVRRLHGWARVAVAGYLAGGYATAQALRSAQFDVLAAPVRPSRLATAGFAIRTLIGSGR
jgi:phytoene/squalene synthetase